MGLSEIADFSCRAFLWLFCVAWSLIDVSDPLAISDDSKIIGSCAFSLPQAVFKLAHVAEAVNIDKPTVSVVLVFTESALVHHLASIPYPSA